MFLTHNKILASSKNFQVFFQDFLDDGEKATEKIIADEQKITKENIPSIH